MNPLCQQIINKVSEIVLDKSHEIEMSLVCLLAEGHLLIEDIPGVGKTTLVQALSKLLGFEYSRIQFTNDLLPSDILGNVIFDNEQKIFSLIEGPIFSNLILADELNRANPRTQSALLQCMEENQVTLDKKTYQLPNPFMIIATQNPHHQIGTFALPESQLDRFLMSMDLNYAGKDSEIKIFQNSGAKQSLQQLQPVCSINKLKEMQEEVQKIHLSPLIAEYIYLILNHTRTSTTLPPLSTRSGISLARASKACAFLRNNQFVTPEDIKTVAIHVLGHRLNNGEGIKSGKKLVEEVLEQVSVPH